MTWWKKRAPTAPEDPARALMQRYCAGDPLAFRDLYDLLAPALLADLAARGCDGERAAEVLEAAFLALHGDRRSYVLGADPKPWLLALARRQESALAKRRAARASAQPRAAPA